MTCFLKSFSFLFLAAFICLGASPNQKTIEKRPPLVQSVDAIGFTVSDMRLSLDFYTRLLGFEKISEVEVFGEEYEQLLGVFGLRMKVALLKLGNTYLELSEFLTPRGRPIPIDSKSNDLWFQQLAIRVSDMQAAYRLLHEKDVQHISSSPQRFSPDQTMEGSVEVFLFEDPDGHPLELIAYPGDKIEPSNSKNKKLFIEIDHTGLVVDNMETSLRFYKDLLGLDLVSEWENKDPAFQRLVGLKNASVKLARLKAKQGPNIVLMEYVSPQGGRSIPSDTTTTDLWHWQVKLSVGNVEKAQEEIRKKGYLFVSSGIPFIEEAVLGFKRGFVADDPDGHMLLFAAENH